MWLLVFIAKFLPNPFLINSEHSWKSFSQLIISKTGDPYREEKRKKKPIKDSQKKESIQWVLTTQKKKIRKFRLKVECKGNFPENPFGNCRLPLDVVLFVRPERNGGNFRTIW